MLKTLTILTFFITSVNTYAQFPLDGPPKATPDTLYFAYKDDIQLIIIDAFDTYNRLGAWHDAISPRGGSWFMDNEPAPRNVYLFRDKGGEIIKIFNADSIDKNSLKNTSYCNADELSLMSIMDYRELNNHLMFFEEDKVGLINLKGDIIVPAIYDNIMKYQRKGGKRDKLIIVKDNKFGFLDSNLKVLFPPIYQTRIHIKTIDGENIVVLKNDKFGLISEEGEVLIDFLFDGIRVIHDSMYMGSIHKDKNEQIHAIKSHWDWGYQVKTCILFNKDFKILTKFENFEYIYYYGTKRFIVKKDNKFGVINHLGEVIVPLKYDELVQKSSHYLVQINNKWGIVSLEGKVLLPIQYEGIEGIFVIQNGLIGICNRQFKLIAEPQFVDKTWDMGKYILTRKDGSKGFVKTEKKDSYYQSPEGKKIKL
jgi:hypothetical protein